MTKSLRFREFREDTGLENKDLKITRFKKHIRPLLGVLAEKHVAVHSNTRAFGR